MRSTLCPLLPAPSAAAAAAGKAVDLLEFVFTQLQKKVGIVTAVVEVRGEGVGVWGDDVGELRHQARLRQPGHASAMPSCAWRPFCCVDIGCLGSFVLISAAWPIVAWSQPLPTPPYHSTPTPPPLHNQMGYNFLFGLWKYQWDADCELFLRIILVGGRGSQGVSAGTVGGHTSKLEGGPPPHKTSRQACPGC